MHALSNLGPVPGDKKAVVVLSDGRDNRSKTSLDEVIALARRDKVPSTPSGLVSGRRSGDTFSHLAHETGGESTLIKEPKELIDLYPRIAASYTTNMSSGLRRSPDWMRRLGIQ